MPPSVRKVSGVRTWNGAIDCAGRIGNSYFIEHFDGEGTGLRLLGLEMQADHLADLVTYSVKHRKRTHGFLENHGYLVAADLPDLLAILGERDEIDGACDS